MRISEINWRLHKINQLRERVTLTDNDLRKVNMSLKALVTWIALEIRHNLMLMAENERLDLFNKYGRGSTFWVTKELTDKDHAFGLMCQELEDRMSSEDIEDSFKVKTHLLWNPKNDAMFRFKFADVFAVLLTKQPFWCEYSPKSGRQGRGEPPKADNLKAYLDALPQVERGFDFWEDAHSAQNPKLEPPFSDENEYKAMVYEGAPRLLYDTQETLGNRDDKNQGTRRIVARGAGTGLPLPTSLTSQGDTRPGVRLHDTQNRNLFMFPGNVRDTTLLLSRPHSLPIAEMVLATKDDIKAMNKGCVQGCPNNRADFRFRPSTDREPTHTCPFCKKEQGERQEIHNHLEVCEDRPKGWMRTKEQKARCLPLTPVKGCGHSFCSSCANVSILTAPPYAVCMACGVVAREIRVRKGAEVGKLTRSEGDADPPIEVYQSQNPLDHHARRFYQMKGYAPKVVTDQNWMPAFPLEDSGNASSSQDQQGPEIKKLKDELAKLKQILRSTQNDLHGSNMLRDDATQDRDELKDKLGLAIQNVS